MAEEKQPIERYWRIRMRAGDFGDFSKQAWLRGEVGVWYGAWSADDLRQALRQPDPAGYLSSLPTQRALGWDVSAGFFQTTKRFADISANDWVLSYFDSAIHLGRLTEPLRSDPNHPLNLPDGQVFKYRPLGSIKSFPLRRLPDPFRIVPQAGRGNVHEFNTTYDLVRILAASLNEEDAARRIDTMPLREWLDVLGPEGWESLALGYLILEDGYVPTGLIIGGTLAVFDIVGRSRIDNAHIIAQCKKAPYAVLVGDDFTAAFLDYGAGGRGYFFAYGGCVDAPGWLRVLSRDDMEEWLRTTERGQWYMRMFLGRTE